VADLSRAREPVRRGGCRAHRISSFSVRRGDSLSRQEPRRGGSAELSRLVGESAAFGDECGVRLHREEKNCSMSADWRDLVGQDGGATVACSCRAWRIVWRRMTLRGTTSRSDRTRLMLATRPSASACSAPRAGPVPGWAQTVLEMAGATVAADEGARRAASAFVHV